MNITIKIIVMISTLCSLFWVSMNAKSVYDVYKSEIVQALLFVTKYQLLQYKDYSPYDKKRY